MDKKIREGNVITIDLDYWTTQAERARIDDVPPQYIRQRVYDTQRGLTKTPIEFWNIPELQFTLVSRED